MCRIGRDEGLAGYFKGMQAKILQTALNAALMLSIKEQVTQQQRPQCGCISAARLHCNAATHRACAALRHLQVHGSAAAAVRAAEGLLVSVQQQPAGSTRVPVHLVTRAV